MILFIIVTIIIIAIIIYIIIINNDNNNNNNITTTTTTTGSISSLKNWEKTKEEVEVTIPLRDLVNNNSNKNNKVMELFKVDEVGMFVPNYCSVVTDYYVVL